MKVLYTFLVLILSFCSGISQKKFKYKCSKINNKSFRIKTINASRPLPYQGENVYITKYSIEYNNKKLSSFYSYRYSNKLFLIDDKIMKLNHTKDQVVFSLPKRNLYNVQLSGILSNAQLYLSSFVSMNNKTFYKYMVDGGDYPVSISEIIFDEELLMDEIRFKSNNSICKCTKSDIVIKLN